jgi:hypothetical protein
VWHAPQGLPVLFANAGFAIVGRGSVIIAAALDITANVAMVPIRIALFVFAFCIVDLLDPYSDRFRFHEDTSARFVLVAPGFRE